MFVKFCRLLWELIRWMWNGGKVRTQKEMLIIHNICSECPHFVKDGGFGEGFDKCGICECNLHPSSTKLNKIALASTKCPDNPSRWP